MTCSVWHRIIKVANGGYIHNSHIGQELDEEGGQWKIMEPSDCLSWIEDLCPLDVRVNHMK